jgi:universal stress protein A
MLGKPRRILWPTDFSEHALRGGRYAWGFAQRYSAEFHILHVIPPPLGPDVSLILPAEVPVPIAEPQMLDAAKRGLTELVRRHFNADAAIRTEALFGDPWRTITEYARSHQIELIVVTTHGRTGLGHALIGSTAEKIVQHAPCPVLVVKRTEQGFLMPEPGA